MEELSLSYLTLIMIETNAEHPFPNRSDFDGLIAYNKVPYNILCLPVDNKEEYAILEKFGEI